MARLDFVNARVRARRSRLLGASGLRELLWRASPEERLTLLRQSIHAEAAQRPDVASALTRSVIVERRRIEEHIEGRRPRALWRALGRLDDAEALKTILRGLARGQPASVIVALAQSTAELPDEEIVELANQTGADALVEVLRRRESRFASPLAAALPAWRRDNQLGHLDAAIDGAARKEVLSAAQAHDEDSVVLRRVIERQADALERANAAKLEGGEAAPWVFDRALEREQLSALRREARARPLSLAVPLLFLGELRAEVRLLRLILLTGELGPPADEMLTLLEPA